MLRTGGKTKPHGAGGIRGLLARPYEPHVIVTAFSGRKQGAQSRDNCSLEIITALILFLRK
jgi:hypothetical protein